MKRSNVICVHIGARAHYLIPAALQRKNNLHTLVTDTWIGAKWLRLFLSLLPLTVLRSLAGRYHASIPSEKVSSFGWQFLLFELRMRLRYSYSWALTCARDQKFESEAYKRVCKINDAEIVLGISYTSLQCFKAAREKGLKTLLFQVDPGLEEENLVATLVEQSGLDTDWERAPHSYWQQWQEECKLADRIFVNSQWSKDGLMKHGVSGKKIHILPLPFDILEKHKQFRRSYPEKFTNERPLKCLFLGTLTLRKGIHLVIEAARSLQDLPIEFIFAGRTEIDEKEFAAPNIQYKGIVTREETDILYQQADVFLFPTLSDGFGLTQLEALSWQLPVIASRCCGNVVEAESTGWLLESIDAKQIEMLLQHILTNPESLNRYAANCLARAGMFSTERFASSLSELLGDN